jgi:hypothetical protein
MTYLGYWAVVALIIIVKFSIGLSPIFVGGDKHQQFNFQAHLRLVWDLSLRCNGLHPSFHVVYRKGIKST